MKNRTMFYLCITLKNIVAITGFCVLAYLFHHWWIALFSLLFLSSIPYIHSPQEITDIIGEARNKNLIQKDQIRCCCCGEILFVQDAENSVHTEMQEKGWKRIYVADEWKDICPTCAEKYYNKR